VTVWVAPFRDFSMFRDSLYYRKGEEMKILPKPDQAGDLAFIPAEKMGLEGTSAINVAVDEVSSTVVTMYGRFHDVTTVAQSTATRKGDRLTYTHSTIPGNCGSPIISSGKKNTGSLIGVHSFGSKDGDMVENGAVYISPSVSRNIVMYLQKN